MNPSFLVVRPDVYPGGLTTRGAGGRKEKLIGSEMSGQKCAMDDRHNKKRKYSRPRPALEDTKKNMKMRNCLMGRGGEESSYESVLR